MSASNGNQHQEAEKLTQEEIETLRRERNEAVLMAQQAVMLIRRIAVSLEPPFSEEKKNRILVKDLPEIIAECSVEAQRRILQQASEVSRDANLLRYWLRNPHCLRFDWTHKTGHTYHAQSECVDPATGQTRHVFRSCKNAREAIEWSYRFYYTGRDE